MAKPNAELVGSGVDAKPQQLSESGQAGEHVKEKRSKLFTRMLGGLASKFTQEPKELPVTLVIPGDEPDSNGLHVADGQVDEHTEKYAERWGIPHTGGE